MALVCRLIMVAFVAAALGGLLGHGPFSHATTRASGDKPSVDYEPVARYGTPTTVTFHVANMSPEPQKLTIAMDFKVVQPLGLQRTNPIPESTAAKQGGLSMTFDIPAKQSDALIQFVAQPSAIGIISRRASGKPTCAGGNSSCPDAYRRDKAMMTVLRAVAAYWILLFAVRLIGRRTVSQMAPFDLIVLFLFAGTTITAVLADDRSMVGAVSAVFTIGLTHILVSWLKERFDWFGRIVDGTPVVIFENGRWQLERMHTLRIQKQDVMAAARRRGLERLEQVRYAIVERDGKVSTIEQES